MADFDDILEDLHHLYEPHVHVDHNTMDVLDLHDLSVHKVSF